MSNVSAVKAIDELVEGASLEKLPEVIEGLKRSLVSASNRLKIAGDDPDFNKIVTKAHQWLVGYVEDDILRKLLIVVSLQKGKTTFDESSSNMRRNKTAAEFDVQFTVGCSKEFISGSASDAEGYHDGQIEMSFLAIMEDDLDKPFDWSVTEDLDELQAAAEKWRVEAGLVEAEITWQNCASAILATVSHLVQESKYNDDDWVWDFVTNMLKTNLLNLPCTTNITTKKQRIV
mmetsp:Transcript_8883/g.9464  ORF Transcript_8883/g.9464 Transcript_8883/m.9464 type:complete len:232 (-) Transcript_8883:32-727(-)